MRYSDRLTTDYTDSHRLFNNIMTDINDLSYKIIGCAYDVHKILGPGLLESTYEKCLCFELDKLGIKYDRQKELPIN